MIYSWTNRIAYKALMIREKSWNAPPSDEIVGGGLETLTPEANVSIYRTEFAMKTRHSAWAAIALLVIEMFENACAGGGPVNAGNPI